MMTNEHRPWWEEIALCKGTTKKGKRCKNFAREPFEIEPGHLYIPLTCNLHKDQEEEIRRVLDEKIRIKHQEEEQK
jgi:hypothetical protein